MQLLKKNQFNNNRYNFKKIEKSILIYSISVQRSNAHPSLFFHSPIVYSIFLKTPARMSDPNYNEIANICKRVFAECEQKVATNPMPAISDRSELFSTTVSKELWHYSDKIAYRLQFGRWETNELLPEIVSMYTAIRNIFDTLNDTADYKKKIAVSGLFIYRYLAPYSARYREYKPAAEFKNKTRPDEKMQAAFIASLPDKIVDLIYVSERKSTRSWLLDDLFAYNAYAHARYRMRRFLDQSNLACYLHHMRKLPLTSVQMIGELACQHVTREKPLPVRMPRLSRKQDIQRELEAIVPQITQRSIAFTRMHLKRILDAIIKNDDAIERASCDDAAASSNANKKRKT